MQETNFPHEKYSLETLAETFYAAAPRLMTEAEENKLKAVISTEPSWRQKLQEIVDLWLAGEKPQAGQVVEKLLVQIENLVEIENK